MNSDHIRKELEDIYGISCIIKPPNQPLIKHKLSSEPPLTATIDTWELVEAELKGCKSCKLCLERTNIVFGEGNRNAELMFVGEGPGAEEDRTGRPFVGKAGALLTKMIAAMGYAREDVYIANIVKCRPPDNRKPFKDETDACIGFVKRQIALIKPKAIVCLGETATTGLLNTGGGITRIRGKFLDYNGIKVMPTFHPAYLLRNESAKKDVWSDLKMVMAVLESHR